MNEINYVYILRCADGTYYTGWTNNLEKRVKAHNDKVGAKYTKGRVPVKLVYYETYLDKTEARKREYYIKQMTPKKKLELISSKNMEDITN